MKTGSESLSYFCRLTALLRVLVLRIWFSLFVCLLLCWFRSNSLSKASFLFITINSLRIIFDLVENMYPHSLNAHRDPFFQCLMLLLGSAVLMSIHKTDRVEYTVKVHMVCILMDRIDALISLTNFICDHRSDHIGLVRSDKLAAMEGHQKVPDSDLIILLEGCRHLLHLLGRIGDIHTTGSYIAAGCLMLLCDISDHIIPCRCIIILACCFQ